MTTTEMAISLIAEAAEKNNTSLRGIAMDQLRAASGWRPFGFALDREVRRKLYEGKGQEYVSARLKDLFPKTPDIPVMPFNLAALYAETSATFYELEPTRTLVDIATREELDEEDERVKAFADLVRSCGAAVKMPEAERRAEWCLETIVAVRARKTVDATGALVQAVRLELHHTENAWIVPDPDAPTDEQRARAFALKTRHGASGKNALELWTRDEQSNRWTFSFEAMDGSGQLEPPVKYDGDFLPFIMVRSREPDASPYVERGSDDVDTVIMQLVDESDAAQTERLQGHTDRVYKGTRKGEGELPIGPDKTTQIDPGEDLYSLDYNPKIVERAASLQRRLDIWERTTRSPQGSFSPSAQVPESGIARQIRNLPAEKKAREHAALYVEMESRRLWPVAIDVWNKKTEGKPITGVEVRVTPRHETAYEDPEARQRRLQADVDMGVLSKARYAVEMGHYRTVAEAVEDGISDDLKGSTAPGAVGLPQQSALAAALAARRGAPPEPAPAPVDTEGPDLADETGDGEVQS
jgi:hypothetical protein